MKISRLLIFALCLAIPRAGLAQNPPTSLSQLENTSLPKLTVPEIDRQNMKNGMRLLLLKDDELPVVRGYLYVATGEIYDPADKVGLAELTGALLRSGGTESAKPDRFDEQLADLAAEIDVDMGREYALISFKALKEDLPKVLAMLFDMLRHPAFDPQKLELKRLQMMEALRRQNDNPMDIAGREFPKQIYGADNVWSRTPTPESVKSITRDDIANFYRRFFYPDRMVFAFSGDFSDAELVMTLDQLTTGWPKAPEKLPEIAPVKPEFREAVVLIPKSADQSTIFVGHLGDKRFNPDKYALLLLNEILGGDALTSRLGKRIRSSLGLVYGIFSRFGLATDYGVFSVIAQTQAKNTAKVIEETRDQLSGILSQDIGDEELKFYKNSLLNSLYAEYEPKYNFARDEGRFEFLDYPPNYLQLFREKIELVSVADLQRVAKKYLHPDQLQVLVVGDPKQIGALPNAQILDIGAR